MNAGNRPLAILVPIVAMALSFGCGHDEPHHADGNLESVAVTTVDVELVSG